MNILTNVLYPLGIIILIFWYWFKSQRNKKYYQNIPMPPTVPILGNALDFTTTTGKIDFF